MNKMFAFIALFIACSVFLIVFGQFVYYGTPSGIDYSDWKWWVYLAMSTIGMVGLMEGGRFYHLWCKKYKKEKKVNE